jgi:hypothetical protein
MLTPEQVAGIEKFQRYLDPDGDGIPYRTLPGISPKASYFTRGSGHSKFGAYTEDSASTRRCSTGCRASSRRPLSSCRPPSPTGGAPRPRS